VIDLTRVTYVVFRHVSGTLLKFLLRKPSVALAFLHTLLDIDKLERIQNRAIRFVKKDYKSRETGAITRMREDLELETLEDRRLSLRLILMYIRSSLSMSPLRYGFQMVAPYSMIDLTRVTYVVFRHVSGTFLKFLLRKPSDCINSSVRLFADDCLLYRTIKKEEDHLTLQTDIKHLEGWANKWGMRFNNTSVC
jgi:hypothetical protein